MSRKLLVAGVFALVLTCLAGPSLADPGRGSEVQCYAWVNNPISAIGVPYVPTPTYSYNQVGRPAAISVTRTAVGTYSVTCRGVGGGTLFAGSGSWGPGGHVQVTAYGGEDADYCKVVNWSSGGPDFTANVKCYRPGGVASDNRFDLLFIW